MERERLPGSLAKTVRRGDALRCLQQDYWKKLTVGKVYVVSDLHKNDYDEVYVYLVGIPNTIFSPELFAPCAPKAAGV